MQNKKGRRTRKQLIAIKEASSKARVDEANALRNPLLNLTEFHKYKTSDGKCVTFRSQKVGDLSEKTMEWIFDLMERNMKAPYDLSNWGWNESSKQKELTDPAAWYLLASIDDELIGFSHFRYDLDDKIEVLYCYELQLEPTARRKGIGRFMMNALEALAHQSAMKKVVLTVLKLTPGAIRFYQELGYRLDKTNPPEWENMDYLILCKWTST